MAGRGVRPTVLGGVDFLSPADIAKVADRVCATLDEEGNVLLVNWRGRSADPADRRSGGGDFH